MDFKSTINAFPDPNAAYMSLAPEHQKIPAVVEAVIDAMMPDYRSNGSYTLNGMLTALFQDVPPSILYNKEVMQKAANLSPTETFRVLPDRLNTDMDIIAAAVYCEHNEFDAMANLPPTITTNPELLAKLFNRINSDLSTKRAPALFTNAPRDPLLYTRVWFQCLFIRESSKGRILFIHHRAFITRFLSALDFQDKDFYHWYYYKLKRILCEDLAPRFTDEPIQHYRGDVTMAQDPEIIKAFSAKGVEIL